MADQCRLSIPSNLRFLEESMTMGEEANKASEEAAASPGRPEAGIPGEHVPSLDPKIQDQLGRVFRSFCDDLVHQPMPDKLLVLLARLEAKQREKK